MSGLCELQFKIRGELKSHGIGEGDALYGFEILGMEARVTALNSRTTIESTMELDELAIISEAGFFGTLPPFGESPLEGQQRFVGMCECYCFFPHILPLDVIKEISENLFPTSRILLVTHGMTFSSFMLYFQILIFSKMFSHSVFSCRR
jgi:hypothetical protein